MRRGTESIGIWEVEWHMIVPNCNVAENLIKGILKEYLFQRRKEFYSVEIPIAIKLCEETLKTYFKIEKPEIFTKRSAIQLEALIEIQKLKMELNWDNPDFSLRRKPKE